GGAPIVRSPSLAGELPEGPLGPARGAGSVAGPFPCGTAARLGRRRRQETGRLPRGESQHDPSGQLPGISRGSRRVLPPGGCAEPGQGLSGNRLSPLESSVPSDSMIAGGPTMSRSSSSVAIDDSSSGNATRRAVLRTAVAGAVGTAFIPRSLAADPPARRRAKRVIIARAGIGGLCCAYELMERGHDLTGREASGRAGGHVRTMHDPFPDGLYADVGAEHFTRPGYEQYWKYVEKFHLPALPYPRRINMLRRIDGTWYTEEQLQESKVLRSFGFN